MTILPVFMLAVLRLTVSKELLCLGYSLFWNVVIFPLKIDLVATEGKDWRACSHQDCISEEAQSLEGK